MSEHHHGWRALLLADLHCGQGTVMELTSAQRIQAAYDGLLEPADRETPWEGGAPIAPSSITRFPPIEAVAKELDRVNHQEPVAA